MTIINEKKAMKRRVIFLIPQKRPPTQIIMAKLIIAIN